MSESAEMFAVEKFVNPALSIAGASGSITIRSQADYDRAGVERSQLKALETAVEAFWKSDPAKLPEAQKALGGALFHANQVVAKLRLISNAQVERIRALREARDEAIREYDARKQEELRRKQDEEERKRRDAEIAAERARQAEDRKRLEAQQAEQVAERARVAALRTTNEAERKRLEEESRKAREVQERALAAQRRQQEEREAQERAQRDAEERQQRQAAKAQEIARGPEGTTKVTRYLPTVIDKAAFIRWVCRTENWHLVDVADGPLSKHVNALAGQNLPDGVVAKREDVIRRKI